MPDTKVARSLLRIRKSWCAASIAGLIALGTLSRMHTPGALDPVFTRDSSPLTGTANSSVFSTPFWTGARPPGAPLVYKIAGNPQWFVFAQFVVAAGAWGALGVVASLHSIPAGLAVLLMSQRWNVHQFDDQVMTESLAHSTFALAVAAWILVDRKPAPAQAAALVLACTLWAATRDPNAYLVTAVAVGSLVVLALRRPRPRAAIAAAVATLLLGLGAMRLADAAARWRFPLQNVVAQRVLPDEEQRTFFASQGMPISDALMERSGRWAHEDGYAFDTDPRLESFRAWLEVSGKRTYVTYLLLHPVYFVTAPLSYAPTRPLLIATLAGLGVLICGRSSWRTPALLAACAYPLALVVWHGDAMGIERHMLQAQILGELAALLAIAAVAERLAVTWSARSGSGSV